MGAVSIIWLRELKKYWRNKSRIIGSLGMPFFMLVIVGGGLNRMVGTGTTGGSYQAFIMPGIVGMVLLFASMFSGVSVIWDKQFGFMKEILVAPVSRTRIIIGKTLGGATTALLQALLMLLISLVLGIRLHSVVGFFLALVVMFLISVAFVALGTAIASKMTDMHGFQLIMNFLIMPLFFLSGALFPLTDAPAWLQTLSYVDPLTYGVEALRYCFLGASTIAFPLSVLVLIGFTIVSIGIGTYFFNRMEV
jgi:ABC-2 type transport system permease protein